MTATVLVRGPVFRSMAALFLAVALGLTTIATASARQAPESFADLAEELLDAVVNISTSQTVTGQRSVPMPNLPEGSPFQEFFEEFFNNRNNGQGQRPRSRRVNSLGSGFVVDPGGIIITNNHVIEEADEIDVNFSDGTALSATVIGRDPKTDLAVLKVEPEKPLKSVGFARNNGLRVGDWVMAIGNPFGLGGSVTVGIVSAINRDINSGPYDDFIQTDAAINRGNSGGPLFNMDGEVVGINTAIISPTGGSIGIGFAVPTRTALPVIEQLQEYGETRRGWLGVRIQNVTDEIAESLELDRARGALVAGVNPDGPAAEAGIEPGDVVLTFDGQPIPEMRDLPRIVADTRIGKSVKMTVWRKGEERELDVTVARLEEGEEVSAEATEDEESEEPEPSSVLGLTLSGITKELAEKFELGEDTKGVVVSEIDATSAAYEFGLREGDVIVEVAQQQVAEPGDVVTAVDQVREQKRKSVLFLVERKDGVRRYVAVRLDG